MRHLSVFLLLIFTFPTYADSYPYGIYSNVSMLTGEPSGFEILVLNNGTTQCELSIMIQSFEGWPQTPELLQCCDCWTNQINFQSSYFGPFEGIIEQDVLTGQFLETGQTLELPKGQSFWQR